MMGVTHSFLEAFKYPAVTSKLAFPLKGNAKSKDDTRTPTPRPGTTTTAAASQTMSLASIPATLPTQIPKCTVDRDSNCITRYGLRSIQPKSTADQLERVVAPTIMQLKDWSTKRIQLNRVKLMPLRATSWETQHKNMLSYLVSEGLDMQLYYLSCM
jgi:hypothetical protein